MNDIMSLLQSPPPKKRQPGRTAAHQNMNLESSLNLGDDDEDEAGKKPATRRSVMAKFTGSRCVGIKCSNSFFFCYFTIQHISAIIFFSLAVWNPLL